MVFFLMSSLVVLLVLWDGRFTAVRIAILRESSPDLYYGVVLSMKPERFNHTQQVLTPVGFRVDQKWPPRYKSEEVDKSLESYIGSRELHNTINLKVWSNQMAFVSAMTDFVKEANTRTPKKWRFFFEDDLALNPNITADHGKVLIAKGLELADEDGFVYLGLCGPSCEDSRVILDQDVEAARCAGTCAHAFGFQARTAAKFLQNMNGIKIGEIYMDQILLAYGRQLKKVWLVGSNLRSPADGGHCGLLYQDRIQYPTTIG